MRGNEVAGHAEAHRADGTEANTGNQLGEEKVRVGLGHARKKDSDAPGEGAVKEQPFAIAAVTPIAPHRRR